MGITLTLVFILVMGVNMTVEQAIKEYELAVQKAKQARKEATDAQKKALALEFDVLVKKTAVIDAQHEAKIRN